MLIFKNLLLSEIPEHWSDSQFFKAKSLILSLRAKRPVTTNEGLSPRIADNPPVDTSMRKSARIICAFCDRKDFDHGPHGIIETDPDGFVRKVCHRTDDEFRTAVSYVKQTWYDVRKVRLPLGSKGDFDLYPLNSTRNFASYREFGERQGNEVTDYYLAAGNDSLFHELPVPEVVQDFDDNDDWLTDRDRAEAAAYESQTDELGKLERWRDIHPEIHTVTLEEHQDSLTKWREFHSFLKDKPRPFNNAQRRWVSDNRPVIVTEHNPNHVPVAEISRSVFVEGNAGFTSIELVDDVITRKYHARLLNVYLDRKTKQVAIGSIRLSKNADGTTKADCVKCRGELNSPSLTGLTDEQARYEMESFTWSVVAHGNNHAADWFRSRPLFHKVHELGCDGKCDENASYCDPSHVSNVKPATDSEVLRFLMDHNCKCRDKRCFCDGHIASLMPIMAAFTKVPA